MSNYSSFEAKENGILERVESFCRHLTTGGSFTESSPVALDTVEACIDDAYYWLLGELAKNGYSLTITNANVKKVLEQIQVLDAVTQIEYSVPVGEDGKPNNRYIAMTARRDRLVSDYLRTDALEQLGATRSRSKSDYLEETGRSVSRKDSVYENTDAVPARFPRGFNQNRNIPSRSGRNVGPAGADPNL